MHAAPDVVLRDRDDETQIGGDELVFGVLPIVDRALGEEDVFGRVIEADGFAPLFVSQFAMIAFVFVVISAELFLFFFPFDDAFGKFSLFFCGEKIDFPDFLQIHLHRVIDFDLA